MVVNLNVCSFKQIYPIELELGRENTNDKHVPFIDLDINLNIF